MIRVIPDIFSDKFPNLSFLSIKNSSMSVMNAQTFNKCGINLVYIDASYNEIHVVDPRTFEKCKGLKTVDLSGNSIAYIDGKIYSYTPTLKSVILVQKVGVTYPLN